MLCPPIEVLERLGVALAAINCCICCRPAVQCFLRRLGLALDTALNMPGGGGGRQQQGGSGGGSHGRQRVFGMLLVRGTPFYTYHAHERVWVKIMM